MPASDAPSSEERLSESRRKLREIHERSKQKLSEAGSLSVKRVVVGGGFAATAAYATRALAGHDDLAEICFIGAAEPWRSLEEWPMGQPATELVSEAFVCQPAELDQDQNPFCPSLVFANAISLTQAEREMPVCEVTVGSIKSLSGQWEVSAGTNRILASTVDVANGRGPAEHLDEVVLPGTLRDRLILAGKLVVGDHAGLVNFAPTGRVLVVGGSATGAWFVMKAADVNAQITWLATAREPGTSEAALRKKLARLRALLHRVKHPLRLQRWLDRCVGFRKADLPRNRTAFGQETNLVLGDVTEINDAPSGVRVSWTGSAASQYFDRIVVAIGQNTALAPGPGFLLKSVKLGFLVRQVDGVVRHTLSFRDPASAPRTRILGLSTKHAYPVRSQRPNRLGAPNIRRKTHGSLASCGCW